MQTILYKAGQRVNPAAHIHRLPKVVDSLLREGGFSFELLNIRLRRSSSGNVNTTFKAKIAELKEEQRPGTEMYYANVLSSVEKFKGTNIPFSAITPD